jgi:hypothetical protein
MLQLMPVESATPHTVNIPESLWDFATEIGQGNTSKGVRRCLTEIKRQMDEERSALKDAADA